jgi:uncharacterized membrane protein YfcA
MLLILIGLISGIISGMGIGGGTVLIPALIYIVGTSQHVAQSINLTAFLPTAIAAIIIHAKNKHIKFKLALQLISVGAVGAILGSKLAVSLSSATLRRLFGIFLLIMGIYEFFRKEN